MDHSVGDAIGGRTFFENTIGDEILDFFLEQPVNVIIPAHLWGLFRLTAYSWGRNHGGVGRKARTAERLWRYVVGKVTLRNGARIIEKTGRRTTDPRLMDCWVAIGDIDL